MRSLSPLQHRGPSVTGRPALATKTLGFAVATPEQPAKGNGRVSPTVATAGLVSWTNPVSTENGTFLY